MLGGWLIRWMACIYITMFGIKKGATCFSELHWDPAGTPPQTLAPHFLQAYGWDTLFLGSVADHATEHSTYPIMVIRDYTPPKSPGPLTPALASSSASVSPAPITGLTMITAGLTAVAAATSPASPPLIIASHSKHV